MRSRRWVLIVGRAADAALRRARRAETWPVKPIRAIIPFGAGSATDIIPRIVFEQLVDPARPADHRREPRRRRRHDRRGAVAKADPDGYTLLATSSAIPSRRRSIRT